MRKIIGVLAVILILIAASACDSDSETTSTESAAAGAASAVTAEMTWQDYYDLGIRYLSEGNYQEAIIAFTAAIEIEPKRAEAYVGRGDVYVSLAQTGEDVETHYMSAVDDYLTAIETDAALADVYRKIAEVYIELDDKKAAIDILKQGVAATGNSDLQTMLEDMAHSGIWGMDLHEMTPNQQQYIQGLVAAVVQGNTEYAWNELKKVQNIVSNSTRIEYEDYKIEFMHYGGDNGIGGSIQIRPHTGTGFYCSYHAWTDNENFDQVFKTGHCENWNWNGEYTKIGRYTTSTMDTTSHTIGMAQNSLKHGVQEITFTTIYSEADEIFPGETHESKYSIEYENGVELNNGDTGLIHSVTGVMMIQDNGEHLPRFLWNGYWDNMRHEFITIT